LDRVRDTVGRFVFALHPRNVARVGTLNDPLHRGADIHLFGTCLDATWITAIQTTLRADEYAL
jgi:hypothetical protein